MPLLPLSKAELNAVRFEDIFDVSETKISAVLKNLWNGKGGAVRAPTGKRKVSYRSRVTASERP